MKSRSGRAGFSLIELLVVVVIIGILVALASPRLRRGMLRNEVLSARNAMANMYTTARLSALQANRPVTLQRVGNVILITSTTRLDGNPGLDTVGAVVDLNSHHGVTVAGSPTSIAVNPKGLGGAAFLWTVSRAEFADTLQVTTFGRIVR